MINFYLLKELSRLREGLDNGEYSFDRIPDQRLDQLGLAIADIPIIEHLKTLEYEMAFHKLSRESKCKLIQQYVENRKKLSLKDIREESFSSV